MRQEMLLFHRAQRKQHCDAQDGIRAGEISLNHLLGSGQQAALQLPQPHVRGLQLLQLIKLLLQARLLLLKVPELCWRVVYRGVLRTPQTLSSAVCW